MVFAANASALSIPPPEPVQIDLGDGLVFHITPTWYEPKGYPTSGLYRDGVLVYTVDRDSFWNPLFFSSDGMSFLELPTEWHGSNQTFIRFYQEGVLSHRHYVRDLLKDRGASLYPVCFVGPAWEQWNQRYYDRDHNILRIVTVEDVEITFDLTSGRITSREGAGTSGLYTAIIGLGTIGAACVLASMFVKGRRCRK